MVLAVGRRREFGFHADEEEFEKQLATGTEPGNRVLVIDNVRLARGAKEIASSVLERCVTATTLKFRRLGKIASIIRANDVLFVLTMNNARPPASESSGASALRRQYR